MKIVHLLAAIGVILGVTGFWALYTGDRVFGFQPGFFLGLGGVVLSVAAMIRHRASSMS